MSGVSFAAALRPTGSTVITALSARLVYGTVGGAGGGQVAPGCDTVSAPPKPIVVPRFRVCADAQA